MKGVPANNVHYEYKIDRRKDRLFSTFIPPQQIEDDGGKIIGQYNRVRYFWGRVPNFQNSAFSPLNGRNLEPF